MDDWATLEETQAVSVTIASIHFEGHLFCKTTEKLMILCTVLGLAHQWRIRKLDLPKHINAESLNALIMLANKGKADYLSVNMVVCKTAEDMKTLCSTLGVAQQWRIGHLRLEYDMQEESWEALSEVAGCGGEVNVVLVTNLGLRAAKEQQIHALWKTTGESGWWKDYDDGSVIAQKREGDAGLQKLLVQGGQQTLKKTSKESCQLL